MKKYFAALSLLAVVALPAFADGMYVFGDVGTSKISNDSLSENNSSYSLGIGYSFNQTFSLELAYRDLGKIDLSRDQYSQIDSKGSAVQGSVLAKFPVSDSVSLFGRLGFAGLTYDYKFKFLSNPDYDESHSDEQNKGFFGVGADYKLNEHVSFRTEYNQYGKWESLKTSTLTVGAVYSF